MHVPAKDYHFNSSLPLSLRSFPLSLPKSLFQNLGFLQHSSQMERSSQMDFSQLQFVSIDEAANFIDQKVNIVGVVVEAGLPKTTRGTDCMCSLKIVDSSKPTGITINFFTRTMAQLPLIERIGDIIVITRVMMNRMGSEEVGAVFNKTYSSFALFEGKSSSSSNVAILPYQSSALYKARYQQNDIINRLKEWSKPEIIDGFHSILRIREIQDGESANILCKILHVGRVGNKLMMFIWDGTDTPPTPVESNLALEMGDPLPLAVEPSPLPMDLLRTFPTIGTVLRVFINQEDVRLGVNLIKTNRWAKLVNLRCEEHFGLWYGVLTPYTKLCYYREDNEIVCRFKRSYTSRCNEKMQRLPFTAFPPSSITEAEYGDLSPATLMDIVTHREMAHKFFTVVRIVAIFPSGEEELRAWGTSNYRVRLTLEDPTARIHCFLFQDDAEKLFEQCRTPEDLTKARNALLGISNVEGDSSVVRNPQWIKCCIRSYYEGSRNYRIVDTRCILSEC